MATRPSASENPRTFFLNEQHELAHAEKAGGGATPKYGAIDWVAKARSLGSALNRSRDQIAESADPLKDRHFFMVARPEPQVPKVSTSKNKPAEFLETTEYDGVHSRVFRRLGIDLIEVASDGTAAVHATTDRLSRLLTTARGLDKEGAQERARWATISSFAPLPATFRIDDDWFATLRKTIPADVVIELQPLLTRVEVEEVLAAIVRQLSTGANEAVLAVGTDFSGRRWLRTRMRRDSIRNIADKFYSVQALHSPFATPLSAARHIGRRAVVPSDSLATRATVGSELPTIAVVDSGIPQEHVELAPYVRGRYRSPDAAVQAPYLGDHGSFVASRIVFGDLDFRSGIERRLPGDCRVYDVMVAKDIDSVDDKAVLPALQAIVATSPDVRVFNLSFGEPDPLAAYSEVEQRERLLLVQDLDNFIFAQDVIVVVAAGNSRKGLVPTKPYPEHHQEPAWQLGAWPAGFNSLTCGATAEYIHPETLARGKGWPSPFSRVGPGIAGAPVPEYGANGGNLSDDWRQRNGLGVWGCTASGDWEDRIGTSHAAPLLAREAAFAFQILQGYCAPGARPFAATVKAFLAATAARSELPATVSELADKTIGRGTASVERLRTPNSTSALFLWQGIITGTSDVARVQVPIPRAWLSTAGKPVLRLICVWDAPVNEAVRKIWACRKIAARLRPDPTSRALTGSRGGHSSYPIIDRTYDVSKEHLEHLEIAPTADSWVLELSYEQLAEYYAGMTFSPQQRVAFAAELVDLAETPVSPQRFVQMLPGAVTMTRLSVPPARAPAPVVVRTGA